MVSATIVPAVQQRQLIGSGVYHSHSTPCEVCRTEGAPNHMIEPGVWHIGSSNPKRPGYFHEVRLAFVGATLPQLIATGGSLDRCTCEIGSIQRAKGRAAHCSHVKQVRWFEAPFACPKPQEEREPELFEGDELEACAPVVKPLLTVRQPRQLMAVEERTQRLYLVSRGSSSWVVRIVDADWTCQCSRDRMTEATYCDHILNVLRFRSL